MLDVPLIDSVGDMIQLAIMAVDIPPKALAMQCQCSASAVYGTMQDMRSLPRKARQAIAQTNLIAAAAVAMESTGLTRLFGYQKADRHIQSMILRLKKHDHSVLDMLDQLPMLLLDKESKEDLTDEELAYLYEIMDGLVDRINCTWNLAAELETKYRLDNSAFMEKKKSPVLAHRRL